ncbi:MAG: PH domain-containing protein [Planctomycetota bacterium]|jgi:uncharacterized membrane protein YdbT with pleckstrin-like domain
MPKQADATPLTPHSRHRSKSCPFCAETIRYEAVKCRYCGEFLYGDRRHTEAKFGFLPLHAEPEEPDRDSMDEDEEDDVLWYGRPSVLALFGKIVKTAIVVTLCLAIHKLPVVALVAYLDAQFIKAGVQTDLLIRIERWIDLVALALAGLAMLVLLCRIVVLKSVYYEVTPDRIEWSRGIFDRQVDNLDMFRVIDLKLRRSLLESLLGIGTVRLTTKDDSDPQFDFVKVHDCRSLYDVIKEAGLEADKTRNVIHVE